MKKSEIFENVVTAVTAHFGGEMPEGLDAVLAEHLAPKAGGASVNLDEVTRKNDEGTITEIMCSTSGVWMPADLEHFYADKAENPRIVNGAGEGLKRQSKAAEKIAKEFNKTQRASISGLTDDILNSEDFEEISGLKDQLREVKAAKPDYSAVTA